METRTKSNAEFQKEVNEVLTRHESGFESIKDQFGSVNNQIARVDSTLQVIIEELKALRTVASRRPGDFNDKPLPTEEATASRISGRPDHHQYHQQDRHQGQLKLSFPTFGGSDPHGWIYKSEQYFEFKGVDPHQRVQLASFHLEGAALQWHRWFTKYRGQLLWDEFTAAVLQRFGPTDYEDPAEALTRLKQVTTIAVYQAEFEKLSQQVDNLPENYLVSCFISGLSDEIRLDVKVKQPRTLSDAIGVARLVEERNLLQKKTTNSGRITNVGQPTRSAPTPTAGVLGPAPAPRGGQTSPMPFRRISSQEAKDRRERGLCFYCDDKFVPGHRCQRPQLFMIEDLAEEDNTHEEEKPLAQEDSIPEISLHAIAGTNHPQTIRLIGKMGNKEITVLVDGGSTHNFIDQSVAAKFGLPVERDQNFQVMVANGEKIKCAGRCLGLTILVQGQTIRADFYVLPVAACQAVLGVQWLETLGPIETDYRKLTMTFHRDGVARTLQGLTRSPPAALRDKELLSLEGLGFFFQMVAAIAPSNQPRYSPELHNLLTTYEHIFLPPTELPPRRAQDHRIPLAPHQQPVSVRPYRYAQFQKSEIERLVQEFLDSGLIRPSNSPFSSPVLLVKKQDGNWRFCVDYRALNSITVKDRYPIPVIDELLDELHGATYFSKMDLRSGYHQIRVRDEDIHKTAFRTHEGHYEFVVMPFGLSNAPATFQGLMNDLFRPYLRKFVLVFFDDILVYSKSWLEHMKHLRIVLSVLSTNRLYAKQEKCQFGVEQVNYLGHVISWAGVQVDQSKVAAVNAWPIPTTTKQVRGFLGLAGYYRKFIRGFGGLAEPLTRLLNKEGFQWTPAASDAFNKLKQALMSPPILRLPDFTKPFLIESDACGTGIGAILLQEERPIAFYSDALKGSMLGLSTYEKEMIAIVKAIRKWRPYLLGKPFIVRTDQRSLKFLMEQRITTPAQTRWLPKIMGYDYQIQYRRGRENGGADALSRVAELECSAISLPDPNWWQTLQHEVRQDPFYQGISGFSSPHFFLRDGVWFKSGRIYLSSASTLIPVILKDNHSSPVGGHFGYHRTLQRVKQSFYWSGMRTSIKDFIKNCDTCQRCKYDCMTPAGLLQPLPIPQRIWTDVSMDFIEGLPNSAGYTVIMVVVDRLSKYAHFIPLKHPYTATGVAKAFIDNIVKLHGVPSSIVSDRDKVFVSLFWKTLFHLQGTSLNLSSSYHPQTDGQTEVVNRTLEQYLRCFVGDRPKKWMDWLTWAEYSYNTSVHAVTKTSPYEAVYGQPPPSVLDYVPGTTSVQAVDEFLRDRTTVLRELRHNLTLAQERMKKRADLCRREVSFAVGDYVYLKLQPYRQTSVAARSSFKLSPRFFGPFRVIEKIGPVAYKLDLPVGSLIHNVFHVSRLKKGVGVVSPASPGLTPISETSTMLPQPEAILDRRTIQKGKFRPKTEILVRWKGALPEDATWEDLRRFGRTYPHFVLEDKEFPRGAE